CDPKSRIRIFECFGAVRSTSLPPLRKAFGVAGRTGLVFMDALSARRVRWLDRRGRVLAARSGPDPECRVALSIQPPAPSFAQVDQRSRRQARRIQSRGETTRASSAHFRNEAGDCKSLKR